MTKNKNFWAAAALVSLAVMVFSAYSIYGRVSLHFSGDTIEVRPVPMPPPQEEEGETAEPSDAKEEPADKREEAAAAAPAAPEAPRTRAVKTVFEYKDAKAKKVQLAGSFTSWNPKPMTRKNGVWKAEIYILPGTYPYHFTVDGAKKLDPGKPKAPTGNSLVTVE
jgi:hypothetical protein